MSIYGKLYWLTRLDSINASLIGIIIALFVISIIIIIWSSANKDFDEFHNPNEQLKRKALRDKFISKIKWLISIACILWIVCIFTPTKNEAIFIVAGGKTIDFIQKDSSINKIPSQTTELVSEFLNKQIKALKEKK